MVVETLGDAVDDLRPVHESDRVELRYEGRVSQFMAGKKAGQEQGDRRYEKKQKEFKGPETNVHTKARGGKQNRAQPACSKFRANQMTPIKRIKQFELGTDWKTGGSARARRFVPSGVSTGHRTRRTPSGNNTCDCKGLANTTIWLFEGDGGLQGGNVKGHKKVDHEKRSSVLMVNLEKSLMHGRAGIQHRKRKSRTRPSKHKPVGRQLKPNTCHGPSARDSKDVAQQARSRWSMASQSSRTWGDMWRSSPVSRAFLLRRAGFPWATHVRVLESPVSRACDWQPGLAARRVVHPSGFRLGQSSMIAAWLRR